MFESPWTSTGCWRKSTSGSNPRQRDLSDLDTSESLQSVEAPTDFFPWPPRAGESALDAFATTWKESVFHPTRFFRSMPRAGDYGAMIGYYLIVSVVAAGVQLFWHMVLPPLPIGPL